jgi:hypothetical protein
MSKFAELKQAAEDQRDRQLGILMSFKHLVLEVLPEVLEAPPQVEGSPFIRYYDLKTGEMLKADVETVPFVFGSDARIAFAMRLGKHSYVPIELIYNWFPHQYQVRVHLFKPTLTMDHPPVDVQLGEPADLAKLAEAIFQVALAYLHKTLGLV